MIFKRIFISTIFCVIWVNLQAQGCSDAGFCTLNSLRTGSQLSTEPASSLRVGSSYGSSYNKVNVVQSFAEFSYRHSKSFESSLKLTHAFLSGNLGSTQGLSDLFLSSTVHVESSTSLIAGLKIPLNNASGTKNNLPLPMNYQSSLGTFDAILGLGYVINKLSLNAAIQYPITQNNNGFLAEDYAEGSDGSTYISTNNYERRPDALLRVSYLSNLGSDLTLVYGLLPILHLGNDSYTDGNGLTQSIDGSSGLTLNVSASLFYTLKSGNQVEFLFGAPLIARKKRPEGLSQLSLGVVYNWRMK